VNGIEVISRIAHRTEHGRDIGDRVPVGRGAIANRLAVGFPVHLAAVGDSRTPELERPCGRRADDQLELVGPCVEERGEVGVGRRRRAVGREEIVRADTEREDVVRPVAEYARVDCCAVELRDPDAADTVILDGPLAAERRLKLRRVVVARTDPWACCKRVPFTIDVLDGFCSLVIGQSYRNHLRGIEQFDTAADRECDRAREHREVVGAGHAEIDVGG
jgi:hypothetical protein